MVAPQSETSPSRRLIISAEDLSLIQKEQSFRRYGIKSAQHQRATDFFLLRDNGTGFRFSIVMADLAERLEVGVLSIESAKRDYYPEFELDLPNELSGALRAERLVLRTEYGKIDSGLVLMSSSGGEIVIVAGVYPYTIEVKATQPLSNMNHFDPEYSLDRYEREPMFTGN